MSDTIEYRPLTVAQLYECLENFIRDNAGSRDVTVRWLAGYAVDLKTQAYHVQFNNRLTIEPMVNAFRLEEITDERAKLMKQEQALEQEARKLTVSK